MPNRKSYWVNAYESALAVELPQGDTSMTVADGSALPSGEFYLVIEPTSATQREYVWVTSRNGNILNGLERNLNGSAGDVTHPVNSVVRTVALAQGFEDLHLRADAAAQAVPNHEADPDPHGQYLLEADAAGTYLPLSGGTLTDFLTLHADPTADGHAATKKYVDDGIGAINLDHGGLTGLADDDHPQYFNQTRGDARYRQLSVDVPWADLSGVPSTFAPSSHAYSVHTGSVPIGDLPTGTSSSTVALGDHTHSYLPLSGGTLAGNLTVNGRVTTNDIRPTGGNLYNIGTTTTRYVAIYVGTVSATGQVVTTSSGSFGSPAVQIGSGSGMYESGGTLYVGNQASAAALVGYSGTAMFPNGLITLGTSTKPWSILYTQRAILAAPSTADGSRSSWRHEDAASGGGWEIKRLSSSRRHKQDIVPLSVEDAEARWYDRLMSTQLVRFRSTIPTDDQTKELTGVIAEDEAERWPELIYSDEQGRIEGFSYDGLILPLVAAVQALNRRLEAAGI